MRASSRFLLVLALASCGAPREERVTNVHLHAKFDSPLVVEQLRFELSDGQGSALFNPEVRPDHVGPPLVSEVAAVAVILPDTVAGQMLTARVTGITDGVDVATGTATMIVPILMTRVDVTVKLVPVRLLKLEVTPPSSLLPIGNTTKPLKATGTYDNGSTRDLTGKVHWLSSSPAVATVDDPANKGAVTAVMAGDATITARTDDVPPVEGTSLVHVKPKLTSLAITPADQTAVAGTPQAFVATGTFSDMTTQDFTAVSKWTSSDIGVATIDDNGVALGTKMGTVTIGAMYDTVSASTTFSVTVATLDSIELTPPSASMKTLGTLQFNAVGHYSNGQMIPLNSAVTWATSAPLVVGVSNTGKANAVAAGKANITATLQGKTATAPVTVTTL